MDIESQRIYDNLSDIGFEEVLTVSVSKMYEDLARLGKLARKINVDYSNTLLKQITKHLRDNLIWASNISFRDASNSPKNLLDVYVDLDLFLTPTKLHVDNESKNRKPAPQLLLKDRASVIILGQPGIGKTTTIKKLFNLLYAKDNDIKDSYSVPILISLKSLNSRKFASQQFALLEYISKELGFLITTNELTEIEYDTIYNLVYLKFISRLNPYLIFDGFDEITDPEMKKNVIENLRLISKSTDCSFVLTSRSADFDYHIYGCNEYEICPLDDPQIKEFVHKWFKDSEYAKTNDFDQDAFFNKLKSSPYWDTTIRPLTLSHLCALQERNNSIPEKPTVLYDKIVELLLENWDKQDSKERISAYAQFSIPQKLKFLSRLSYELTTYDQDSKFNSQVLCDIYKKIAPDFNLPQEQSRVVANELESHTGLIIQSRSNNFEFAHKSIQEFLCAKYLRSANAHNYNTQTLQWIPNEAAIWVSLSARPDQTIYDILYFGSKDEVFTEAFFVPFIARIIVEKPEFNGDFILAIALIKLSNYISDKIYIYQRSEYKDEVDSVKSYKKSLSNMKKLFEYPEFKKSISHLEEYYTRSSVRMKGIYQAMHIYGAPAIYDRSQKRYKLRGKEMELPPYLVVPSGLV